MKIILLIPIFLFLFPSLYANDIFLAIEKGDINKVSGYLKNKNILTSRDPEGRTPLLLAAYYKNTAILNSIIKSGADLTAKDQKGANALMYAVGGNNIAALKILYKAGIDLNQKNIYGFTALMLACGNIGFYRFKTKPIFSAGNTEAVNLLVGWGADVHARNNNGENSANCAAYYNHVEAIKRLVEKNININNPRSGGWTPLMDSSSNNHVQFVKYILSKGADTSLQDDMGYTALMKSIDSYGMYGFKPKQEYVFDILVKFKKDLEIKDKYGKTALIHASCNTFGIRHNLQALRVLLENGADINARDKWGFTALHWAAENTLIDIAKFLVQKGADIKAVSNDGLTVLVKGLSGGDKGKASIEMAMFLINSGVIIDLKTKEGSNALFYCAASGYVEIMKLLIEKGSNINDLYEDGRNVLMWAAYYSGSLDAVKFLVESGIDVNQKDKMGKTALNYAEESFKKNSAMIDYLKEKMKKSTIETR